MEQITQIILDPHNSYKIEKDFVSDVWSVTIYKPQQGNTNHIFTWEKLPQWIKDRVMMLDLTGRDVISIPFFGERVGTKYWIFADQISKMTER